MYEVLQMNLPCITSWICVQQDPGLAVRAGRQLRAYHYKNLGLDAPEHGKGHFHHPRRNYDASRQKKQAAKDGEQGAYLPYTLIFPLSVS